MAISLTDDRFSAVPVSWTRSANLTPHVGTKSNIIILKPSSAPSCVPLAMADSESNPAYLIIGIVSTLVLVFFVGNIWAYVLLAPRPAASSARGMRPAVPTRRDRRILLRDRLGLTLSSPRFPESGTWRPRSSTPRSRRRRWAPRNARARCSRRACSRRESRLGRMSDRHPKRNLSPGNGRRLMIAKERHPAGNASSFRP